MANTEHLLLSALGCIRSTILPRSQYTYGITRRIVRQVPRGTAVSLEATWLWAQSSADQGLLYLTVVALGQVPDLCKPQLLPQELTACSAGATEWGRTGPGSWRISQRWLKFCGMGKVKGTQSKEASRARSWRASLGTTEGCALHSESCDRHRDPLKQTVKHSVLY